MAGQTNTRAPSRKRGRTSSQALTSEAEIGEACALHFLGTGEALLPMQSLEPHIRALQIQLQREETGESACGDCTQCSLSGACIRARNRVAIKEGSVGASWAEKGKGLVGRVFKVGGKYSTLYNVHDTNPVGASSVYI